MSNPNLKIYNDKRCDSISTRNITINDSLLSNGTQNITSSFHKSRAASHPDMVALTGQLPNDVTTWATYDGNDIVTLSMVIEKSSSGVDDLIEFLWPVPLQRDASIGFTYAIDQRLVVEELSQTRYGVLLRQSGNVAPSNNLYSFTIQYNVKSPILSII